MTTQAGAISGRDRIRARFERSDARFQRWEAERVPAADVTGGQLAQQPFRDLLEAAPDAIVIVDQAGEIVLVNSRTEAIFGYRREELIGRSVETLMPERDRRAHAGSRRRFLADPRPRRLGAGLDLTARHKDGTEFPVEIGLSPLRTGEGLLTANAIRDVTDRRLAEERLAHQALHDPLTGLPNRALLGDRLEQALIGARQAGGKLAVCLCDVDDFKRINDCLGHDAGDELLAALPSRLAEAVRPADTIARFGGDEFVIVWEELASNAEALRIAERITGAFQRPFEIDGREHHLSASVGVVVVDDGEALAAEVLRDANVAMHRAKEAGTGRFELFDARMRARVVKRLRLEEELHRAIRAGELRLVYQPVLSLEREEFVGAEALIRWQHPDHGLLAPEDFIDVAEESGLIIPIGAWVVREAFRRAATWTGGPTCGAPWVSINLSPRQLTDGRIVATVAEALADSGLDPARVELEITETALLEGASTALANLDRLKGLGVRLALDDFGTGHSSLGRLKRFPIDALKVDRGFVDRLGVEAEDTAIVAAMIAIAGALEVEVIAEGVETPEQLAWLAEHGCPLAQGFLLGVPVPAERLELLAPWSGRNGNGIGGRSPRLPAGLRAPAIDAGPSPG